MDLWFLCIAIISTPVVQEADPTRTRTYRCCARPWEVLKSFMCRAGRGFLFVISLTPGGSRSCSNSKISNMFGIGPKVHCRERTSMKIFWTPCGSTFERTLGSKPAGCQASRKQCRNFEVGAGPASRMNRARLDRRSRKHWQKQKVFPGVSRCFQVFPGVSRVCDIWSESSCVLCWILLGFYLGGSSEWLSCETHVVPL